MQTHGYTPNGGAFQPQQRMQFQQQPQGQQQHQQNQQPNGNMSTSGASTAGDAASSGQSPPEMNLANVLHYLQSEWRRWERDRNEWEIERAEMRARIALLEGERRSAENLKVDLMRRVRMLEFALRQERSKTLTSSPPAGGHGGIAPARFAALQDEDKAGSGGDKEGSASSEGSDEEGRSSKANGVAAADKGMGSIGSTLRTTAGSSTSPKQPLSVPAGISAWKAASGSVAGRDPRSRARSREYLKQCLQEVTYLTSPGALNPLPAKPLLNLASVLEGQEQAGEAGDIPSRPKKALPEQTPESIFGKSQDASVEGATTEVKLPTDVQVPQPEAFSTSEAHSAATVSPSAKQSDDLKADLVREDADSSTPAEEDASDEHQVLTAIYKPESKAAWREELRAANEVAEKAQSERSKLASTTDTTGDAELAGLTYTDVDEVDGSLKADDKAQDRNQVWKSRRSLRSHIDAVRSLCFYQGPEILLASGGDDCTVKVWSIDPVTVLSNKHATLPELEPTITLRGHTAPITSVCISSSRRTIFSASLDSTIRLWTLPHGNHDPYAPHDNSLVQSVLVGHTDAVWGVCLLPPKAESKDGQETVLVSIGADCAIKVWEANTSLAHKWDLRTSFDYHGTDVDREASSSSLPTPTSVAVYQPDFTKVLVGFSNSVVKAFDVRTGAVTQTFALEGSGSPETQINTLLSHPTLPVVLAGTEDGNLRTFDSNSGSITHSLLAHPDAVTSIALNHTSPMTVITSSADCTCRIWDLSSKTSLQELAGHRERADEGVLEITSHPVLPILASAGADGIIRVWSALA